jgi:hypothetical protein
MEGQGYRVVPGTVYSLIEENGFREEQRGGTTKGLTITFK